MLTQSKFNEPCAIILSMLKTIIASNAVSFAISAVSAISAGFAVSPYWTSTELANHHAHSAVYSCKPLLMRTSKGLSKVLLFAAFNTDEDFPRLSILF